MALIYYSTELLNNHRVFKNALYAEFASLGRALANPHRLELLDLLAQGERSVEELAQEAGLSLANASAHLQVLRRARLVEGERRGLNVAYRLAGGEVFRLWQTLRDAGAVRLAEVQRLVQSYLADRAILEAITKEQLLQRLAHAGVVVIDVRPDVEYRQGHVAGARPVPLHRLEELLNDLPAHAEIVAYCRGPYCVLADEAVHLLRRRGWRAVRLKEGFPEWRAAGYPVEAAS